MYKHAYKQCYTTTAMFARQTVAE